MRLPRAGGRHASQRAGLAHGCRVHGRRRRGRRGRRRVAALCQPAVYRRHASGSRRQRWHGCCQHSDLTALDGPLPPHPDEHPAWWVCRGLGASTLLVHAYERAGPRLSFWARAGKGVKVLPCACAGPRLSRGVRRARLLPGAQEAPQALQHARLCCWYGAPAVCMLACAPMWVSPALAQGLQAGIRRPSSIWCSGQWSGRADFPNTCVVPFLVGHACFLCAGLQHIHPHAALCLARTCVPSSHPAPLARPAVGSGCPLLPPLAQSPQPACPARLACTSSVGLGAHAQRPHSALELCLAFRLRHAT